MSRPVFVLDCSMTISWFFGDEFVASSRRSRDLLGGGLALAPANWRSEVVITLVMAQRLDRISAADVLIFLDLIAELPVGVEEAPDWGRSREVTALARRFRLTAYDATYLELAARERVGLATMNKALRRSAAALGLPPVP